MALSNELSSEIAEALLLKSSKTPRELKNLQELILHVHSVLKQLNDTARASDEGRGDSSEKSAAAGAT
jgi:hypothetical protein